MSSARSRASGAVHHELFALDLSSGQPVAGFPIMVDPPYPSGGTAVNQLQRAGLALDGGRILIGYGGNDGDCSTYWGWLVSAPTDGTTGLNSFQVDASHTAGAIWAAGNAPAVDAAGNVFVATGNGIGNSTSDPEYGDSVVKLNASASPLDWWAPPNWQSLDSSDADLGSSMPTLLPGGFLFQSGKDGNGYLLNGAALGHVSSAAAEASGFCSGGSFGGSVYDPANSTDLRRVYWWPEGTVAWLGIAAVASGQGRLLGALGRNRTTDDRRGARVGDELLERHPLRARSDLRHDEKPLLDTGERVRRQPLRQSERRRRAAVRRERRPGDCVHDRPAAGSAPTSTTLVVVSQPGSRGHGRVDDCGNRPGARRRHRHVLRRRCTDPGLLRHCGVGRDGRPGRLPHGIRTRRTHDLAASYSGDAFYAASTSAVLAESVTSGRPHSPVISHASISPRRFTATRVATLRLTLSEAATLSVAVTGLRHGHVMGDRCSSKMHRGKSCQVRVTLLRLHFHARSGRKAFKLSLRQLATGRYTALIYAADHAGHRSRTIRITFTIVRAQRRAIRSSTLWYRWAVAIGPSVSYSRVSKLTMTTPFSFGRCWSTRE